MVRPRISKPALRCQEGVETRSISVSTFRRKIRTFYRRQGRSFPWRETTDPYAIVVSEMMLQQTQTSRVVERFKRFLQKFPSFEALARAPLQALLQEWQGLGYNRRALYLKQLAGVVVSEWDGTLPESEKDLLSLPGVGAYSAGALQSFVFNKPAVFIETNIRAVFLTEFFPGRSNVRDSEIARLVERTLDRRNPREWYYALMDYGVECKRCNRALNTRSAHYVRQTPFQDSVRQVRGQILKVVTSHNGISYRRLRTSVPFDTCRFEMALTGLERDQIVKRSRGQVRIVSDQDP
ncbi:MAG: A/G-specific adenine glycosylase [Proteobacteria bacterium]|nr:A/G-specific adenine glycosylase [Pseudomonadota bacterium]